MTIMKRSMRKAAQKKQLKTERIKNAVKLVSSMLAAGFFMSGFGLGSRMIRRAEAEGSNIKFDGADGALSAANNVFDIYAQQVNGTVATNRFENFTLAGGQIANMYFKTGAEASTEASALFNFVKNDINIAGTVNAVKNNKIGGELFFITPKSIVVSGSGVINAGAITLMSGGPYPGDNGEALTFAGNIQDGTYAMNANECGSVTVAGKLNVTDYISIVSSKNILLQAEKNAAGTVTGTGQLTTNTSFDFKDVVNIKNSDGTLLVDAGLNKDSLVLTRSAGSNGNIRLQALATKTNENGDPVQHLDVIGENTVKASITTDAGTVINAAGGLVDIDATALRDNSAFGNYATFGDAGASEASVTINGEVTGDNVSIVAQAQNVYKKGAWEKLANVVKGQTKKLINDAIGDIGDADPAFLGQRTKSTVTFGSSAVVTATGKDQTDSAGELKAEALRVSATTRSQLRSNVNASTDGSEQGYNIMGVGFLYGYLENEADINVEDGAKLTASATSAGASDTASMKLAAEADTEVMLTAGANAKAKKNDNDEIVPQESDKMGSAILVSLGHTDAAVTVAHGAELTARDDMELAAEANHSSTNEAKVVAKDSTYISTAIQVTNMDSSAKVTADGTLTTTRGKLELSADDSAEVDAYANNSVTHKLSEPSVIETIANYLPDKANELAGNVVKNLKEKYFDKKDPKQPDLSDKAFSLGASIDVAIGKHTAEVNVGEHAVLTSGGAMELTAAQTMSDINVVAQGASSANNSGAVINASVLYAGVESGAAVNVKGTADTAASTGSGAQLTAGGDMKLQADTGYEWNRFNASADYVVDCWKTFSKPFTGLWETVSLKNFDEAVKAYEAKPTSENYKKLAQAAASTDFTSAFTNLASLGFKTPNDLLNLIGAVEAFLDGSTYMNVNAGSVATTSTDSQTKPTVDLAVAMAIEDFNSKAAVVVGDKAQLKAEGNLTAEADAKQLDVNYYGALKGLAETLDDAGHMNETLKDVLEAAELDLKIVPAWNSGTNAVGGTIGWSNNNVESGVIVAEGAKLEGSSVSLGADTDIKRVLVNLGGSVGGNIGFTGMFTGVDGKTNSFVVVDDEATLNAKNKNGVTLTADNDALIVNALGGLTMGSTAIGASVGSVNNEMNTVAAVADNDKDANRASGSEAEKLNEQLASFLNDEQKKSLGLAAAKIENAEIRTAALSINAESSPIIWDIAVAGAVTKKQSEEPAGGNDAPGNMIEMDDLAGDDDDSSNRSVLNEAGANPVQEPISGKSITGAGAVSVQQLSGTTAALLEGTKVNLRNDVAESTKNVSLHAYENGTVVGLDGALGLKTSSSGEGSNTTVSVAGTSAYNDIHMDVLSQIKGSTITDAAAISNYAQQDESLVAVAVPVSMDVSGDDAKGFSTALNLSVNKVDNKVHANMKSNTVGQSEGIVGTTNIQNVAYDTSAQITGGLNVDQAKTTVGLGINAVWAKLKNDVSAAVEGGSYVGVGAFANEAATAMKQVSLSVGMGIGTGETSKASLGAVWAHARLNNSVSANLKNTTVTGQSLTNRAYDGEVTAGSTQTTTWRTKVKELGVDVDGTGTEGVLGGAKTTDVDTEALDGNVSLADSLDPHGQALPTGGTDKTYTNESLKFDTNKGNKIYTGAIEVIGSTAAASKGTLGVAVADGTVDNDYTASVSGVTATLSGAEGLAVLAKTDSYLADFAVGVAVAKNNGSALVSGAGSIAASTMDNDTVAKVEKSTINAAKTEVRADTKSSTAGVAGSLGYDDGKVGVGLAVVSNKLDNETKAAVYGSTLSGYDSGSTAVKIDAQNTGKLFALGLGITAASGDSSYLAAQGNVALNSGKVDTVAEMDKQTDSETNTVHVAKVNKASSVQVKATDKTTQTAAAAGLGISTGKATAGVGYASNAITGQTLAARLNNAVITAADSGADVDVTTDETMKLVTVAAGVAAGKNEWGALQGYAAINKTQNKQNMAELVGTTLTDTQQKSDVLVKALADNKIVSNTDAVTVNVSDESKLSAGLAVSTIDLNSNVNAKVENTTLNAKDVEVNATSGDKMYNVAVGVGGSGSKVNAAGSVSTNSLTNNVSAIVNASTVKALNSVGVLADSSERMVNVTGGVSLGVKSAVGLGLSVAVNDFGGDTVAKVSGSVIEAQGQGTKKLKSHQFTTDAENKMTITETEHKGLVVDAYSDHDSNDVVVTLGVAATGEGASVGLAGTGSSEKLTGKTEALVEKTDINKDTTVQGDVTVTALEKTDLDAVDVNVSVAAGESAAVSVGAGVSVATLDRDVNAKLVADTGASKTLQADKLTVEAGAKSDAKLVTVGVDVGISGSVGVGVGAVVDSLTGIYDVNAEISNITGSNNGLTLRAAHDGTLDYEGVGVVIAGGADGGAAVGAVVGVMKDESKVTGTLRNVTQDHRDTSAADVLAVTNYGESTPDLVSVNISGGAYGAGSVGVVVDNHKLNDSLRLELDNAHLASAEHSAAQADLTVNNKYKLDKDTRNVTIAAALGSGAVGVTSHPITINSSNVLNVTGSDLYARTLNLTNKELRHVHIDHSSFTGALGLDVGVAYTHLTMGGTLQNSYATSHNDSDTNKKSEEDLLAKLNIVNDAVDNAEKTLQTGVTGSAAALPDTDSRASVNHATLATGGHYADKGTVSAEGQLLRASNSNLVADDINLSSTVTDDIDVYSGSGGFGLVSVNVNMATVDETIKNKIDLAGGSLAAKNIGVLNRVTGNTYSHAAIGLVGGLSINLGYADVYAKGKSSVAVDGTTLLAKESLLMRSLHDSTYKTYTNGGSYTAAEGSYTEAESKDSLTNSVTVQNATLTNLGMKTAITNTTSTTAAKAVNGALEIAAVKSSTAESKTMYGNLTGLGVGANSSTAKIDGKSTVTFNNNKVYDSYTTGGQTQSGENTALDLYVLYNSRAVTDMTYGSGGIIGGGGGVAGHATSKGGAEITAQNNLLDVANVSAATMAGGKDDLASVTANAYNISIGLSAGVNNIDATVYTTSTVDFKGNAFGRKQIKTIKDTVYQLNEKGIYEPVHTYATAETGKTDLNLSARTDGTANAELLGVSAAGVLSVGHNKATTSTTEKTTVSLDTSGLTGDASNIMLKSLTMAAEGNNSVYAKADGRNGSILNISPTAAEAFNTSEIITTTTLKGKYQVSGQANLSANQQDVLIVTAPSESGGIVNGREAIAKNTRTDKSETAVRLNGAELQAASANLAAHNDLRLNVFHSNDPENEKHGALLDKHVYGVCGDSGAVFLDATNISFTNNITEKALLDLKSASVKTSGDLKLAADTTNAVFAAARANDGGLGVAGIGVTVDNTFNYSDTISLDSASSLQTTSAAGSISLSAVDDSMLQVGSYANARTGAVTVPVAKTSNTTVRTNQLELSGRIDSANTVHLYSGQYDSTAMAGLHAVVDVQTFTGSLVIPASARTMKNSITENNLVNINSGASVRSVASTDIYANEGAMVVHENNLGASLYSSDDAQKDGKSYVVLSKTEGSAGDVGLTQNNKVNLNGSVVAGYNHELKLTLGSVGEIVILDADQRAAFIASNPELADRVKATPTITASGSLTAAQWQQLLGYETANIVADLMERYESLQTALQKYSADKDAAAYVALQGAMAQVRDQLSQMGMLVKAGEGGTGEIVVPSLKTDVVILPDIAVSGGNVTVQTGSLLGSGSLEAYGKPEASIVNNTNLYMKLGNINVGEAGGVLSVNGTKLAASDNAAALNAAIAEKNAGKAAPSFSKIHCEDGAGGTLEVKNTFSGRNTATESMGYTVNGLDEAGNPVTTHIRFLPDIEVQAGKSITNASGRLTMDNLHGNLLINGEVNARDVVLSAANGTIYQNSLEEGKGLINIGGEVMGSVDASGKVTQPAASSGRIAGSNIFLNALTLNINGLVQSGYANYSASVGDNYSTAIGNLDNLYKQGKLGKLTDDQILLAGPDSAYCLNRGGKVYNTTTNQYDYQVPLYYNPSTGTILVDEISNGGGNIYLSGIIASTGNGRILAMDGTADVTVNNSTNKDIRLYGVNTSLVQGKVTLLDAQKKQQTVITRDKVVVSNLDGTNPTTTDISGSYTYDPADYLRYVWVEGKDSTTRTYKERKYEENWWGLRESKDVTNDTGAVTKETKTLTADEKGNFTVIELDTGSGSFGDYHKDEKVSAVNEKVSDVTVSRWETGLYGYRKHELYEWYVDTGTTSSIKHSVDASKQIAVGFMGNGDAESHITVESLGTVDINGNIGSTAANTLISITSTGGGINQDKGLLKGNNVELSAAGSMKGINILSDNTLKLNAANTAAAGMTYYHNGVGSTVSDGNAIDITAETAAVQQENGTDFGKVLLWGTSGNETDNRLVAGFSLKANGSIEQYDGADISAAKVSLTATNGDIGTDRAISVNTADMPLNSQDTLSASLNAQAHGNINIYETTGNLRLGTVYSDTGDVTLGGVGSLVDALPYDTAQDSGRSRDEQVELWTSLGLLNDGWETDKLLYAISDRLVNPHSGLTTSSKAPNIKAHNINLNMADSAGLLSDETFAYKISELGMKTAEDPTGLIALQKLSGADASSVVWDAANDLVTINQKLPVGIELMADAAGVAGALKVSAGQTAAAAGNVFVEGRTAEKTDTLMNIGINGITAKGSVLLNNALGSVFSAPSAGTDAVISAAALDINAGGTAGAAGRLGTETSPLLINIRGPLRATATDGIYLYQTGDNNLYLQNVSSGGDIQLTADKDIRVYLLNGVETGYLRLENGGDMKLVSNEGSLGEAAHRLSLKNAEDDKSIVIAKAGKDIYLEGVTNAVDGQTAAGQLNVRLENGADTEIVDVQVNGTLNLLNESLAAKNSINLGSVNSLTLDNKNLKTTATDGTITLNVGSMTTGHGYTSKNETADLNLVSGLISSDNIYLNSLHELKQSYTLSESGMRGESGHILEAKNLYATAPGSMDLGSGLNRLNKVTLDNRAEAGANNAIILGNGGTTGLRVMATNTMDGQDGMIHGSVTVNKYRKEDGAAKTGYSLQLDSVQADKDITVNNYEDDVYNVRTLSKGNTYLEAAGNIDNRGRLQADGKIEMLSLEQHIINNSGVIDGKNGVEMSAESFVVNNSELQSSAGDIVLRAGIGVFNIDPEYLLDEAFKEKYLETSKGRITAAGSVIMETDTAVGHIGDENDRIINVGKITAKGEIPTTIHALGEREWWLHWEDVPCKGNVILHSYGDITNYGDITTQITPTGEVLDKDAGSIILDSWHDVINHGQMTAVNSVELDATKDVLNTNKIEAQQHVYITSYEAGVENRGDIVAVNDRVKLWAVETTAIGKEDFDSSMQGDVINTAGSISAKTNVDLRTGNGSLINHAVINSETGDITLEALTGSVYNYKGADLLAEGGNVTIRATQNNGEYDMYYLDEAGAKVSLRDQSGTIDVKDDGKAEIGGERKTVYFDGSVYNSGDIMANGGVVTLLSTKGDVYNFDDFATIDINGAQTGSYKGKIISTGDIDIKSPEGLLYNEHDLISDGSVTLEAAEGLGSFGNNIYAGGDVTLHATQGDLYNHAKVISVEGNVELKADDGTVVNMLDADVLALGGSVTMHAGQNAKTADTYTIEGKDGFYRPVYTIDTKGNETRLAIDIESNKMIVVDKYYLADGHSSSTAVLIDDTVDTTALTKEQRDSIYGVISYVDSTATVPGETKPVAKRVPVRDAEGNPLKVMGDIEVYRKGDVVNRGDVVAMGQTKEVAGQQVQDPAHKGTITLTSDHGNISNYDNFTLVDGKESYEFKGSEIFNTSSPFYVGKKYLIAQGDIDFKATEGYIYNTLNYIGNSNVKFEADDDINIGKAATAGYAAGMLVVKSKNGLVTGSGDLIAGGGIVLDAATGIRLDSDKPTKLVSDGGIIRLATDSGGISLGAGSEILAGGSIDIGAKSGDVDLTNVSRLEAKEMVAVGTQDGKVMVNEITGKEVLLFTNGNDKQIEANKINVEDYLLLRGDYINLNEVNHTGDGWLNLDVTGAKGGAVKGSVELTTNNDTHFTTLNANSANITITDGGRLAMDKLHIVDKGYFNAMDYVTAVYGTTVSNETSPAVYFDEGDGKGATLADKLQLERLLFGAYGTDSDVAGESPSYKKPAYMEQVRKQLAEQGTNIGNFTLDNDGWMNLYIDAPRFQRSNGTLLNLKDYYYANNQRYAANDFATMVADTKAANVYTCYFKDSVGMFDRYNLIDMPEVTMIHYDDVQSGGTGLITVEGNSSDEEPETMI